MENIIKYNNVFKKIFGVEETKLNDNFDIMNVEQWDSVAQMELITALEDEFDLMFDPDDIIEFTSYSAGKELLKRNGIEIE
ncbi:acyl carrier protein [Clostridium botulinum]|nr:acyl carrier protein [Clostridium botulinum]NFI18614.1 acyl carrier protein [Clostridium botulinum]NFL93230.1 acyl carrier protein [Clostridium botulinum]NFN52792.1 acyl carrier protein [Clostridium botulinum]NFO27759.1 acyl carrier protein [Clostridium botulinum]